MYTVTQVIIIKKKIKNLDYLSESSTQLIPDYHDDCGIAMNLTAQYECLGGENNNDD